MKWKKKLKTVLLLLISFGLIGWGGWNLYQIYNETKTAEDISQKEIDTFVEKLDDESSDDTGEESSSIDNAELIGNGTVVGVMYIPSFNDFQHCIAMGVGNDVIDHYVGMYKTYGMIGVPGSNAVFSAHSTSYGYSPIAWFNRIEDYVKIGDEISILWQDGNTYKYEVISIVTNVPKADKTAFEQPEGDEEYITLQTCSYGNGKVRTFMKAIRIE